MAIDYAKKAQLAARLIGGSGRDITLVSLDFDAPNQAKPWLPTTDPRATPARTLTVKATFVPLSTASKLGMSQLADDMVKRADRLCLVGSTVDPREFEEVIDSSDQARLKIEHVEVLQPGGAIVLSYLVLKR